MKKDDELTQLYEKIIKLPSGSTEYRKCLEEIGSLEYKDSFGKGRNGMKTGLKDKPLRFLKGTY